MGDEPMTTDYIAPLHIAICGFPGCGRARESARLCGSHRRQERKGGPLKPLDWRRATPQKFLQLFERGDGCWEWRGSLNEHGYGRFGYGVLAHRYAWELMVGPIPRGLGVLHRCDNPRCIRPDHCFLGDQKANMQDMRSKGRSTRGERSSSALLSESDVIDIRTLRTMYRAGLGVLASAYGVHRRTIDAITGRKTWMHVP
jgi:hypothetical protein